MTCRANSPVFPLPGALLLPRGKLPLSIFEPRYVAMTEDALGRGRMFGMIQPDPTTAEPPMDRACSGWAAWGDFPPSARAKRVTT